MVFSGSTSLTASNDISGPSFGVQSFNLITDPATLFAHPFFSNLPSRTVFSGSKSTVLHGVVDHLRPV
jgi:hypothetical protein